MITEAFVLLTEVVRRIPVPTEAVMLAREQRKMAKMLFREERDKDRRKRKGGK